MPRLGAPVGKERGTSQRPGASPDECIDRRGIEAADPSAGAHAHDGKLSHGDKGLDGPRGDVESLGSLGEREKRRLPRWRSVASGGEFFADGSADARLDLGGESVGCRCVRVRGRHGSDGAARPVRTQDGLPFGAAEVGSPSAFAPGKPGGGEVRRPEGLDPQRPSSAAITGCL